MCKHICKCIYKSVNVQTKSKYFAKNTDKSSVTARTGLSLAVFLHMTFATLLLWQRSVNVCGDLSVHSVSAAA